MSCTLQFVGNATMLLRFGNITVLTDPNFLHKGQRVYLGLGLSTQRLKEPALRPEDLPRLDAVLLSHLHGDHWDRVAQRSIDRSIPIISTPKAAPTLQRRGLHRSVRPVRHRDQTVAEAVDALVVVARGLDGRTDQLLKIRAGIDIDRVDDVAGEAATDQASADKPDFLGFPSVALRSGLVITA